MKLKDIATTRYNIPIGSLCNARFWWILEPIWWATNINFSIGNLCVGIYTYVVCQGVDPMGPESISMI